MIPSKLIHSATLRLQQAGCDSPRKEARLLLAHATAMRMEEILADKRCIREDELHSYESYLIRREKREPIAQILGSCAFWSLDFSVNSHTLAPRADSETLIETVLSLHSDNSASVRILDLGTGSGCLLLSLLHEYPNATGIGVDISFEALKVATNNAETLRMKNRAVFLNASWMNALNETFDIVISNPPYIGTDDIAQLMPEVRDYEPASALDGGKDGLDAYREIFGQLSRKLKKNGIFVLENGIGQCNDIAAIANGRGFTVINRSRDLAGIERIMAFTHSTN